jgi:hypothetical protein
MISAKPPFVLLVISSGYFGFKYIGVKGFGFSAMLGQSEPNSTARTGWGAILWALLGAVIGGGAIYTLTAIIKLIPVPA